ncbi:MAG: hypothetical protein HQ596_02620 [Candidatus Saganbacteria bacterium]|nr:hypothetical protein [Candidatus Saganbacteria bacterium]
MLQGGLGNQAASEQLMLQIRMPQINKQPVGQQPNTADARAVSQTEGKEGTAQSAWYLQMDNVEVTTVAMHPEEIDAPRVLSVLGQKIDLVSKIEGLKENYFKNYALTKSHNLMVSRFAQFKTAALGAMLSMLGVPSDEIENLQKKAVRDAIKQNKMLFEENEYNRELLSIIGASKKRMKTQNRVLNEVRNQLMIQATNLGLDGYYSREKILEVRLAQCGRILGRFLEEKTNLEYQRQMVAFGVN